MNNRRDYLMHYGAKGMKWGVRRYEDYQGHLTPSGKRRYNDRYDYDYNNGRSQSARRYRKPMHPALKRLVGAAAVGATAYGLYKTGAAKKIANSIKDNNENDRLETQQKNRQRKHPDAIDDVRETTSKSKKKKGLFARISDFDKQLTEKVVKDHKEHDIRDPEFWKKRMGNKAGTKSESNTRKKPSGIFSKKSNNGSKPVARVKRKGSVSDETSQIYTATKMASAKRKQQQRRQQMLDDLADKAKDIAKEKAITAKEVAKEKASSAKEKAKDAVKKKVLEGVEYDDPTSWVKPVKNLHDIQRSASDRVQQTKTLINAAKTRDVVTAIGAVTPDLINATNALLNRAGINLGG